MDTQQTFDPTALITKHRKILGMSAILLPFMDDHSVDWESFDAHVKRTCDAGLVPAVNMDTGYANLIDSETREEVLKRTQSIATETGFVAGAYVPDSEGCPFDYDCYAKEIDAIQSYAGIPVIFQSYGLTSHGDAEIVGSYQRIASTCDRFIAFELGSMFAPFGSIYSLEVYEALMKIPECMGAKHSSLNRELEWSRLRLRDRIRSEFHVFTGNDLAIDMVMFGSDYLLGLSTFCPDWFAKRDQMWQSGDPKFYQLNDMLQYLGFLAFRDPVPAYKHSAAMFLKLRGWIKTSMTHQNSPARPESDKELLKGVLAMVEKFLDS